MPNLTLDARVKVAREGPGVEEKGELACEDVLPARADDLARVVVHLEPDDPLYADRALHDRTNLRDESRGLDEQGACGGVLASTGVLCSSTSCNSRVGAVVAAAVVVRSLCVL